ncbi:MAG: nuclear transport factor 2 family protein [Chitinophagaceae bacterium]
MSKFFSSILFCFLLGNVSLVAQTSDEKAVANAVENLRKAMLTPDKATLEGMVSSQLTYGHSSGLIEDKAAFVDALASGRSVFTSMNLFNQTISVSKNVALVRHRLTGETNNNNVAGKVDLLVLLVWQKIKGQWILLARQAVKTPA